MSRSRCSHLQCVKGEKGGEGGKRDRGCVARSGTRRHFPLATTFGDRGGASPSGYAKDDMGKVAMERTRSRNKSISHTYQT